jgi:hypothetical protein
MAGPAVRGEGGENLHHPLQLRPPTSYTCIRCLPPFGYELFAFHWCHCRKKPDVSINQKSKMAAVRTKAVIIFLEAWDNDAISTATLTFSTKPDLDMTLSTCRHYPTLADYLIQNGGHYNTDGWKWWWKYISSDHVDIVGACLSCQSGDLFGLQLNGARELYPWLGQQLNSTNERSQIGFRNLHWLTYNLGVRSSL